MNCALMKRSAQQWQDTVYNSPQDAQPSFKLISNIDNPVCMIENSECMDLRTIPDISSFVNESNNPIIIIMFDSPKSLWDNLRSRVSAPNLQNVFENIQSNAENIQYVSPANIEECGDNCRTVSCVPSAYEKRSSFNESATDKFAKVAILKILRLITGKGGSSGVSNGKGGRREYYCGGAVYEPATNSILATGIYKDDEDIISGRSLGASGILENAKSAFQTAFNFTILSKTDLNAFDATLAKLTNEFNNTMNKIQATKKTLSDTLANIHTDLKNVIPDVKNPVTKSKSFNEKLNTMTRTKSALVKLEEEKLDNQFAITRHWLNALYTHYTRQPTEQPFPDAKISIFETCLDVKKDVLYHENSFTDGGQQFLFAYGPPDDAHQLLSTKILSYGARGSKRHEPYARNMSENGGGGGGNQDPKHFVSKIMQRMQKYK